MLKDILNLTADGRDVHEQSSSLPSILVNDSRPKLDVIIEHGEQVTEIGGKNIFGLNAAEVSI
jgi:hypothetical protein